MNRKKTLQELTLKDNFMFGAVMCDEKNCHRLLELILDFPIARVEVSKEKSILYHPGYKGVRLDVYAKDEHNTHYDVEMQAVAHKALGKRARYYQSQIDMELLLSGEAYENLPNTYVIFICDFDPFGEERYCYTFTNRCEGAPELYLGDGCTAIFLSTHGKNDTEVAPSMVKFLKYVKADLEESNEDFGDEFVASIQKSVEHIKQSRRMEEHFMTFEELLREERQEALEEGRQEGVSKAIITLLGEKGDIPNTLKERIAGEKDLELLTSWLKLAAKAKSVEYFQENM